MFTKIVMDISMMVMNKYKLYCATRKMDKSTSYNGITLIPADNITLLLYIINTFKQVEIMNSYLL